MTDARTDARSGMLADLLIAVAFLVVGLSIGPLVAVAPALAVVGAGGALLVLLAVWRPVEAVAGYVLLNPLLVGLDRGAVVPFLRLNEVLLLPLLAGLFVVLLRRWARKGWAIAWRGDGIDVAVLALAFTGSVTTLVWNFARNREITADDLLYAVSLWKLVVLYAVVRLVVRDPRSVRRTLTAVVVSACLVGVIGVLQALGVGPVIDVLSALIPVGDEGYTYDGGRAMATVGNPIAFGDIMIFGAIVAAALAWRVPGRSRLLWAVAAALCLCTLASGQVSIVLGLAVAALSFAIVTRTVGRVVIGACALLAVAAVVLQPILDARLSDSDPSTGLPSSWTGRYGRLENLQQYFLPDIGTDFNWVFGVRTAGRAEGQEFWRPWVYIESGYVWALWTGGLLLLVAVAALLVSAVRAGRRLVASTDPTTSAVGIALVTLACTLAFLMIFDPHLTFRGGSELLFVLLALGAALDARTRRPDRSDDLEVPHAVA